MRLQLSYDKHLANADQIFRVSSDFVINGHRDIYANAPRPMGYTLQQEFPPVLAATKITGYNGLTTHTGYLQSGDKQILCEHLFAADSNFLKVFEIPMVSGGEDALRHANTAVISETLAMKLFNSTDVIGKQMELEDQSIVEITGVFQDHPQATYFKYEALVSYTTFFKSEQSEIWWYGGHVMTYLRTIPGFQPSDIYTNWDPFFRKYMKPTFDQLNGTANIILQPLTEIHLWEPYIWEPYPHGNLEELIIFGSIGLFLLLVACFNYTNLTLSQSCQRRSEVGIRKVLGANRTQLIRYRVLESLVIGWFASLLAISLLYAFNPVIEYLDSGVAPIDFLHQPFSILIIFFDWYDMRFIVKPISSERRIRNAIHKDQTGALHNEFHSIKKALCARSANDCCDVDRRDVSRGGSDQSCQRQRSGFSAGKPGTYSGKRART